MNNLNIQPIGARVIITPIKQQEKTSGGILIPSSAKKERNEGIIVAIGTCENNTVNLAIGDHIIYSNIELEKYSNNSEQYIILDIKNIIAKIVK